MCHHHRSNYIHGHDHSLAHRGYGYGYNYQQHHHHRRGGPLTALVALAIPLLTQRRSSSSTTEKHGLGQDSSYQEYYDNDEQPYQPQQPDAREKYLAPQTTGRIAAPTASAAPLLATSNAARGPPPAYADDEKNYLPRPTTTTTVTATTTAVADELERDLASMYITDRLPASSFPAFPAASAVVVVGPSSRRAACLQRKEAKARAKLARKAEKWSRRERRDGMEREVY